ncbi:hypothetical protein MJT46_012655 [Ovis ammon polii x Ovis aries]|nr:hypothetical protein MJT46_012655 [Ovis ammon polii x Ovis aries]
MAALLVQEDERESPLLRDFPEEASFEDEALAPVPNPALEGFRAQDLRVSSSPGHHCCCFWVSCETQGGWKLQWRKGLLTLALLQILQMNLILALNERILSARTAAMKGKESCPPGGFSSSPGGEKASVSDSYPSFTTQFKWSLLPEVFLSFFPPGTYTLKLPSGPRRAPGGDDSAQASSQTLVRVFGGAAQDREKGAPGSGLPQECDPRANGPPAELYSSPPCWGSPGLRSSGLGLQPEEKSTENFR